MSHSSHAACRADRPMNSHRVTIFHQRLFLASAHCLSRAEVNQDAAPGCPDAAAASRENDQVDWREWDRGLGGGDPRRDHALALNSVDVGHRQPAGEIWIFAISLEVSSPIIILTRGSGCFS